MDRSRSRPEPAKRPGQLPDSLEPPVQEGVYQRVLSQLGAGDKEEEQALEELRASARELRKGEGYLAFAKVAALIRAGASEVLRGSRDSWQIAQSQGRIDAIDELRVTIEFLTREEKEDAEGS